MSYSQFAEAITSFNIAVSSGLFIMIALTQVLIYPSFLKVPKETFAPYHDFHCRRISWVVAPLVAADVVVSMAMLWLEIKFASVNAVLTLIPLLITFAVFMPMHEKIAKTYTKSLLLKLIRLNYVRTLFWFTKLVFALALGGYAL